jgi:hypothetical protein
MTHLQDGVTLDDEHTIARGEEGRKQRAQLLDDTVTLLGVDLEVLEIDHQVEPLRAPPQGQPGIIVRQPGLGTDPAVPRIADWGR